MIINILDFNITGDCFLDFDNADHLFLDFCTTGDSFGASSIDGSSKENGEESQARKTDCPCFIVITHGNDITIMETDADSRWVVDNQSNIDDPIGVQNESSCCNPNNDGMNRQVAIQLEPDSFSQQHTQELVLTYHTQELALTHQFQ